MFLIRPIRAEDVDALYRLAMESEYGLTTLTRDKDILAKKIHHAEKSFTELGEEPGGQTYLFVLEEQEEKRILGTTAVESKVGGFEPFYSYRIETMLLKSSQLQIKKEERVLHLNKDHSGPSAVGTLFLEPEGRRLGVGRFLSLVRFLFMAEFPNSFEEETIAEMRGVNYDKGYSPFWEAIGRKFFDIDFPKADYLSSFNKKFIKELLPPYPIYVSLLPTEAQSVIGKTHPNTEAALNILIGEGFRFSGYIDIFDGGPLVTAQTKKIRAYRESQQRKIGRIEKEVISESAFIVSNTSSDFRALQCGLDFMDNGELVLSKEVASLLQVDPGDEIRFVSLRS